MIRNKSTENTLCAERVQAVLTPMEKKLLDYLKLHQGEPVTRQELLEQVWGIHCIQKTRTVDCHIAKLRNKLNLQREIETVFKVGYLYHHRACPIGPKQVDGMDGPLGEAEGYSPARAVFCDFKMQVVPR